MKKTLGLALGSGGARGVAHIGFLRALEEEGIKPDYIAGCSMGAVVGGCYASGMTVDELTEVVHSLKAGDIMDFTPMILSRMSLFRSKKIYDLLVEHVKVKTIEEMIIPFRCVATELLSGKLHVFESGNSAMAIQASSAIPLILRPIKQEGKIYVDGGCLSRVPIRTAKDMGADVVVAVDVVTDVADPVDDVKNIVAMVSRIFDIMDSHLTEKTRILESDLCDLLVEPDLKGMSGFEIKEIDRALEAGYAAGKDSVKRIKELLK